MTSSVRVHHVTLGAPAWPALAMGRPDGSGRARRRGGQRAITMGAPSCYYLAVKGGGGDAELGGVVEDRGWEAMRWCGKAVGAPPLTLLADRQRVVPEGRS
jgi:hypothetical protein